MSKKKRLTKPVQKSAKTSQSNNPAESSPHAVAIPVTFQALTDHFRKPQKQEPFQLRKETMQRIESVTGRPLICYVAKTANLAPGIPAHIDHSDLTGFADLIQTTEGDAVDVLIVSNGGLPEAAERIVRLLRGRFHSVRYIVPANAFSAATLICFSGDEIVMDTAGTLGPIDPQIMFGAANVPARAIIRAFEAAEERLRKEGPQALTAYMPLLMKYDLHLFEICKSAEMLSKELAGSWLAEYMLKCDKSDPRITAIVDFFQSYDTHKSHGRSIDRETARKLDVNVVDIEKTEGLADLVRSLSNQYQLWFDRMPFYKVFENARGINWGRQVQQVTLQLPLQPAPGVPQPAPQPGPPQPSK